MFSSTSRGLGTILCPLLSLGPGSQGLAAALALPWCGAAAAGCAEVRAGSTSWGEGRGWARSRARSTPSSSHQQQAWGEGSFGSRLIQGGDCTTLILPRSSQ